MLSRSILALRRVGNNSGFSLGSIGVAAALLLGACSFDAGQSGLECAQEGQTRPGETCRDGYWRVDDTDPGGFDVAQDTIEDTAPAPDAAPAQDVTPAQDVAPPQDTAPPQDVAPAQDVAPPQDTAPPQDVAPDTAPTACAAGTHDLDGDGHCEYQCVETNGGVEICDGLDNNCDGKVDRLPNGRSLTRTCGSDVGQCEQGNQSCVNGDWGECLGGVGPQAEVCDGLDNDCDGAVDNGLPTVRSWVDADGDGYGTGRSNAHVQKCEGTPGYASRRGDCDDNNPITNPGATEICDGENNNCNAYGGNTDNDYQSVSTSASAWCRSHYSSSLSCEKVGPVYCCSEDGDVCARESVCNDGLDEDNDGKIDCADEDCLGLACTTGQRSGVCQVDGSCQPL